LGHIQAENPRPKRGVFHFGRKLGLPELSTEMKKIGCASEDVVFNLQLGGIPGPTKALGEQPPGGTTSGNKSLSERLGLFWKQKSGGKSIWPQEGVSLWGTTNINS